MAGGPRKESLTTGRYLAVQFDKFASGDTPYAQNRYATNVQFKMKATFVELPPFERTRKDYMDDDAYRLLQHELMDNPTAGDVMEGTGGLRKLRQADPRRSKGKRGGLRVIYYWWSGGDQFWFFTVYDKDQADDLTPAQRKVLKQLLKSELENRQPQDGEHDDQ